MREDRDADEALDLVSDLSVEDGRFTSERGRGPTPVVDLVDVTGGGDVLAGSGTTERGDVGEDDTVCKIPAVLVRWGGRETTAKEEGGCRSRMGVGMMRSLAVEVRSGCETRPGGRPLGLLAFSFSLSRSKSRDETRRMALIRSSSESDGLLTLGDTVTSLLILRWCAVTSSCLLNPAGRAEEALGESDTKLLDNLSIGGGENGSSLSAPRFFPSAALIEFSCLNTGAKTGGLPTSVLMSIRGLGGTREDLFVETEAELPGLFGGTNADSGRSESLSEESDDVSESSPFCGCCFCGTGLGTEAVT